MATREEGIKERSKREDAEQDRKDLEQIMGWHNGKNGLVMNSSHAMHVLADEVQRLREWVTKIHNEALAQGNTSIEFFAAQALQPNATTTR